MKGCNGIVAFCESSKSKIFTMQHFRSIGISKGEPKRKFKRGLKSVLVKKTEFLTAFELSIILFYF